MIYNLYPEKELSTQFYAGFAKKMVEKEAIRLILLQRCSTTFYKKNSTGQKIKTRR